MSLPEDFLYELLPAFIRNRDFYEGQPLRALMEVLDIEYRQLWRAAEAQYDDWFIETCRPEQVGAIGELLAIAESWGPAVAGAVHLRALVANTISYRRRKGVPAALENALSDATRWTVRVETLAQQVIAAQDLRSLSPESGGGTVDLRDPLALGSLGTPFERISRLNAVARPSVDPRGGVPAPLGPGYNLTDLGISFWRLSSYPLDRVEARRQGPGCYSFHPLGVDTPLFNSPRPPLHPTDPVEPTQVPEPLGSIGLARAVAAIRLSEAASKLLGGESVLEIFDPQNGEPIAAAAIALADLSSWSRPTSQPSPGPGARGGAGRQVPVRVAVDPVLGRLAFPAEVPDASSVTVSFHYGFGADLGGGPYLSSLSTPWSGHGFDPAQATDLWQSETLPVAALAQALETWQQSGRRQGWIRLAPGYGSGHPGVSPVAPGQALKVDLRGGRQLAIEVADAAPAVLHSDLVALAEEGSSAARLWLSGLWMGGRVETRGSLELAVSHCTLAPPGAPSGAPSGAARRSPTLILSGAARRQLHIHDSILGPIYHRDGQTQLVARDSILDGGSTVAIAAAPSSGGSRLVLDLARVTALGPVRCTELRQAESVIFAGPLEVADVAQGNLRYSYVPAGSKTPPRSRCPAPEPPPVFTSRRYGSPGYAQLSAHCPRAIRCGSEKGGELGAFENLHQSQREAAALTVLAEYMPVGLTPRIVYVT